MNKKFSLQNYKFLKIIHHSIIYLYLSRQFAFKSLYSCTRTFYDPILT